MKIKTGREQAYQRFMETNQNDKYNYAIITYIQRWVNMMENLIDEGFAVAQAANKTQYEADTEGITGFMYERAVDIISQLWEHGEEFKKWNEESGCFINTIKQTMC